jgi:hypothetical protein
LIPVSTNSRAAARWRWKATLQAMWPNTFETNKAVAHFPTAPNHSDDSIYGLRHV